MGKLHKHLVVSGTSSEGLCEQSVESRGDTQGEYFSSYIIAYKKYNFTKLINLLHFYSFLIKASNIFVIMILPIKLH